MIIQIPFSGFYESLYSALIDGEQEYSAEYLAYDGRRDGETLTESNFNEALHFSTSYRVAYLTVAKKYVECFSQHMSEALGVELGLTFESMQSPREYNFDTDRILCNIDESVLRQLRELASPLTFAATIKERHESRDGFASFYSADFEQWRDKAIDTYDHNEAETLLLAAIEDWGDVEWEEAVYSLVQDSGVANAAFDAAVDWSGFEARCDKMRAAKLSEVTV